MGGSQSQRLNETQMKVFYCVILFTALALGDDIGPPENGLCYDDEDCLYGEDVEDEEFLHETGEEKIEEEIDQFFMDDDEEEEKEEEDNSTSDEIAKRPTSYLDKLRDPLKYMWRATKKAANDVYNATAETLKGIEEIVRIVLNEEAYNMFSSALDTFQTSIISSGYNNTRRYLVWRCCPVAERGRV